jgi:hypothetical protein
MRTTRSMRRLKPDPMPNELIRKILELQVGLNGTEIDVLRVTSWHQWVMIVWHVGSRQSRGFAAKHGDVMPHYG